MIDRYLSFHSSDSSAHATQEAAVSSGAAAVALTVEQLPGKLAELSLRLAAAPANGLLHNDSALDAIEHLATQVLKNVLTVRTARKPEVGNLRGMWRTMQFV